MKKCFLSIALLITFLTVDLHGQEYVIKEGSIFQKIFDIRSSTIVHTYCFNKPYILKDSDSYDLKEDHLIFIPADASLRIGIPIDTISIDTVDITTAYDFRTDNGYPNTKTWYALDPDVKIKGKSTRIRRTRDSKWELSTVTVSAKNRFAVGDSIPSTWEMKFSPGFALTTQAIAWDKIKSPKKVTTYGLELGFVANMTTVDINEKTTGGDYKFSRMALTVNVGALLNLSIGKFDLGLFGGIDFPIGEGANKWIYFGVPNWGFLFGIDLITAKK
jgi:hypothetical protein